MNIGDAEIGYLGCELSDVSVMKRVGFGVATADAIDEVKALACHITNAPGGRGAMREICEFILRAMGKWDAWVEKVTKMGYK
jgi:3-deoxy-D-manno-octulosonate 8-phosphate phosphatase (KDO 8-P phosphatase)